MRRTLLWLAVTAMAVAGCADDAHDEPQLVLVTAADGGSVIEVSVGDEITIELEGNPSTGYTWVDESAPTNAIRSLGEPEYLGDDGMVGAAGIMRCRYSAIEHGEAEVDLAYRRPWEEAEPERRFHITIVVE